LQAYSGSCSLLRVSITDEVSDLERAFLLTQRDGRIFAPFGLAAEGASERWGAERSIRASVVRAAAIGEKGWSVTERGLQLAGVRIEGELDLEFLTALPPIRIARCWMTGALVLRYAATPTLALTGSRVPEVRAQHLRVVGGLHLDDGFSCVTADLDFAQIGGTLACSGARFGVGDTALSAEGAIIGSDVHLDGGFRTRGAVLLSGASIGAQLNCAGGAFENSKGFALNAAQCRIRSDVLLNGGFRSTGEVGLGGIVR
jgi:hypothetical protein